VGFLFGDRAAISRGLEQVESVVAAGAQALTDRAEVKPEAARAGSGG
jgi:hypothetical protein